MPCAQLLKIVWRTPEPANGGPTRRLGTEGRRRRVHSGIGCSQSMLATSQLGGLIPFGGTLNQTTQVQSLRQINDSKKFTAMLQGISQEIARDLHFVAENEPDEFFSRFFGTAAQA